MSHEVFPLIPHVDVYTFRRSQGERKVYALVTERDEARMNRKLDLDKSVDEIVAQASGLGG